MNKDNYDSFMVLKLEKEIDMDLIVNSIADTLYDNDIRTDDMTNESITEFLNRLNEECYKAFRH